METIALLDAAVLLYLKGNRDGTGPDMTEFLEEFGLRTTANYLALALRQNLQARGLIKLIGSHRRFRGGAAANLWALTPKGKEEAKAVECLFANLMGRGA